MVDMVMSYDLLYPFEKFYPQKTSLYVSCITWYLVVDSAKFH